jgi:hypothetical protein
MLIVIALLVVAVLARLGWLARKVWQGVPRHNEDFSLVFGERRCGGAGARRG